MNALNHDLLTAVNDANGWFHAKKTRPIWVRPVATSTEVETLEGTESVEPGDVICRGEIGELWPQAIESLMSKYEPTDEFDEKGWQKYTPNPDANGVMASVVNEPFQVHATWGVLQGKSGDFIVKNYSDRDVANPQDVWIVDRALFEATYQRIEGTANER